MGAFSTCKSVGFALILFLMNQGELFSETKFVGTQIKTQVTQWAFDSSTGRIFATHHYEQKIVEYDSITGKEIRTFKSEGKPRLLHIKDHYLIAYVDTKGYLEVYDLKKNQLWKILKIKSFYPSTFFNSPALPGRVFVTTTKGITQIDIEKGSVSLLKSLNSSGSDLSSRKNILFSADGDWILADSGTSYSSPVYLYRFDPARLEVSQVRNVRMPSGRNVAGPANRYWGLGGKLFSLELENGEKSVVKEFKGDLLKIHPKYDWVASIRVENGENTIFFERLSSKKLLKELKLPEIPSEKIRRTSSYTKSKSIFDIDLTKNRLIYLDKQNFYSFDLESLELPKNPSLLIQGIKKQILSIGEEIEVPIKINGGVKAELKLISPVDAGIKLSNQKLVWRPGQQNIGENVIRLSATNGQIEDTIEFKIHVKSKTIDLTFYPNTIISSPDNKFALIVDRTFQTTVRRSSSVMKAKPRLSLVDLEKTKVIHSLDIDREILAAHIDDKYVYYSPDPGNQVYRVNRKDFKDRKRCFLSHKIYNIKPHPDGKILIHHRGGTFIYDSETLNQIKKPVKDPSSYSTVQRYYDGERSKFGFTELDGNKYYLDSKVIDSRTGKVLCLLGKPANVLNLSLTGYYPIKTQSSPPILWGRKHSTMGLMDKRGTTLANWKSETAVILRDYPCVATVELIKGNRASREWTLRVHLRDLLEGRIFKSYTLFSAPIQPQKNRTTNDSVGISEVGDKLLVSFQKKLYYIQLNPESFKKLPKPPQFEYSMNPLSTGVDKPITVELRARGGIGELKYKLLHKVPGYEFDESNGKLKIDVPKLWNSYKERLLAEYKKYERTDESIQGSLRSYKSILQKSKEAFKYYTGEELKPGTGVMYLPVAMAAIDSEGSRDELYTSLFVKVPKPDLDEVYEELSSALQPKDKKPIQAQEINLSKKIEALESRIQKLELIIDSLIKKLNEKDKSSEF